MVLLAILVLSYRQVIEAYPDGGGCYAVPKTNLGAGASHLAGASLVVDYVLTPRPRPCPRPRRTGAHRRRSLPVRRDRPMTSDQPFRHAAERR